MPCDTIWVPGCLFPDCEAEPVVMLDGINGLCREHRHRNPAKRDTRPKLSAKLRFQVLERDGFRCSYCGAKAPDVALHVDHILSRKDGGTDDLENLKTACADCNHGKGSRSVLPGPSDSPLERAASPLLAAVRGAR